jgi:hypothetical protein
MTDLFDLQRFAEEDGGDVPADAGSNSGADDTAPAEEEEVKDNESSAEGAKNDTILGGKSTPNVPDAYDFKSIVPEGMTYDEQSAAAFGDVAKKAGLSQEQAAMVASYGMQYMQSGVDAAMKAIHDTQAAWADEARTQLGGQFDAVVAKAAAGRDALAEKVPGLTQMLNETGAGNRVEMIRLMAAVGELIGEDGGLRGAQARAEKSIYPNTDFKKYNS